MEARSCPGDRDRRRRGLDTGYAASAQGRKEVRRRAERCGESHEQRLPGLGRPAPEGKGKEEAMKADPQRVMTEAEAALIRAVVDARADPRRIADDFIREKAARVAEECVEPEQMARLQRLYNAMLDAKAAFNAELDTLPSFARRPTQDKLQRAYEAREEAEDGHRDDQGTAG